MDEDKGGFGVWDLGRAWAASSRAPARDFEVRVVEDVLSSPRCG